MNLLGHSIDAATLSTGKPSRYYRNKRKSSKVNTVISVCLILVSVSLLAANL